MAREANEVLFVRVVFGDDGGVTSSRFRSTSAKRAAIGRHRPESHVECLATRTLLSAARQRKGLDGPRCELVFAHLDAALSIQTALHRTLAEYRVSELQFGVLVALFALDPEPVMPADLAGYTAVSRAGITDALVRLQSLELVSRTRDNADRRAYLLRLTDKGRATIDEALNRYLAAVARVARYVEPETQAELITACNRLRCGAAELAS
jgi:DNA-binding MarR family transcriptional regulator